MKLSRQAKRKLQKADRIEMRAWRIVARATSRRQNPLSFAAVRLGQRAARNFSKARAERQFVFDQEAARQREKQIRKAAAQSPAKPKGTPKKRTGRPK